MTTLADWAVDLSRELLAEPLPGRYAHVRAATEKARTFAPAVPGEEAILIAAVAVHDVGFAPTVQDTGFSTLDAARYLRSVDAPERLVDLIAHQSMGAIEADVRGYGAHWSEFGPDEGGPVRDAMWTSCLTTGPDGSPVSVQERCEEWKTRYDVSWLELYLTRAQAELEAAERRTRERLEAALRR
jgi:hypothetical protein